MKSERFGAAVGVRLAGAIRAIFMLGVVGSCLLICATGGAQVTGATVSGTLSDPTGAVIPHGEVMIKNVSTGIVTRVTTNGQGFYNAPNLIPGSYQITATMAGFSTKVLSGITLEVGAEVVENVALTIGQETQKVQVTSEGGQIELASSTVGEVVGSEAVVDLPLNGRSWTDLANLQPGSVAMTTQVKFDSSKDIGSRANAGFGAESSIDGARPSENKYSLDGIRVNDFSNGAPSNVIGETPGVDSIQEFSVLTSNYSAEYGLTSGGVINAVTRSGTNAFHGTGYEFFRNSALDARNYFDGPSIPPFNRNQYGASIGGPIRKDRTFFFANFEGLKQSLSSTIINTVPTAAARAGQLCSQPALATASAPCTTGAPLVVSAPAAAYLAAFYPLPNAGPVPTGHGDTGYFNYIDAQTVSDNFFTTRLDHKFTDKDSVSGTFLIGRSPLTFPDGFGNYALGFSDNRQVYSISETHIFSSTFVNALRIGALRQVSINDTVSQVYNQNISDPTFGSQPGADASQIGISGITQFNGGANGAGLLGRAVTNFQLFDDASWVRGTHTIKFGFAGEKQYFRTNNGPLAGLWSFGSLSAFLTNAPTSYQAQTSYPVSPGRTILDTILAGYIQDDWHVFRNLTINLGVRYEPMTIPSEKHGYFSTLPTPTSATLRIGNPFFLSNPTLNNFDPRIGFVWDPFHDGKTSVRGGYGIFDSLPMAYVWPSPTGNTAPFALGYTASNLPKGSFYSGALPYLTASTLRASYIQPNPKRTYIQQRNLSVQRQLLPNLTATITYAGSLGLHLPFIQSDIDQVAPTLTSAGYLYPNPIKSGVKLNTNWGNIFGDSYIATSSYNSLQVLVMKKMSHGFQVQGSYTWGKSLDDASTDVTTTDFNTSLGIPLKFLGHSLSDFDVRSTLVMNAIWQIPDAKSLPKSVSWATNGWQLGAIYKVNDGLPFTPTFGTGGNAAGINDSAGRQNDYPNRLTGPGCGSAVHPQTPGGYVNLNCFSLPTAPNMAFWKANCDTTTPIYGSTPMAEPYPICLNLLGNAKRNSLIGPGLSNLDFSVFKNNKIGEKFNVQLRAEAFNVLNRVNFLAPAIGSAQADLYGANGVPNGSAGVLTGTATNSRQIQLAAKLIF